MPNILPKNDPYNKLFSVFVKDDNIELARQTITMTPVGGGDTYKWRCLVCGVGGEGAKDGIKLGITVHSLDCEGDQEKAVIRADLLDAISNASEESYAAGWLDGIEKILLIRGGMWLTLAKEVGWPIGYRGEDGWETLEEALNRYGTTEEKIRAQVLENINKKNGREA